jgi:toxin ParE1/3/4
MGRYRLDRAAVGDLESIHGYIAQSTQESAARTLRRIGRVFKTLAKNPLSGELRPEIASNLRSFSCGNYVIFFRPSDGGIDVARVLHAARDVRTAMGTPPAEQADQLPE